MVPSNVYNLYREKYPVRVLFCVLSKRYPDGCRPGTDQASPEMPEVWVKRHPPLKGRWFLRSDPAGVWPLALPVPQLPPAILSNGGRPAGYGPSAPLRIARVRERPRPRRYLRALGWARS